MTDSVQTIMTKQNIIDSALSLFAEKGCHGTSIQQIAESVSLTPGDIYSYFLSKEELVNEVFRYSKRLLADLLVEGFDFNAPARQMFSDLWGRLNSFARDYPLHFAFLELQYHTPYLDQESKAVELQILAPVWSFCAAARQQGLCKDMPEEVLISLVWGAFVGLYKTERLGYYRLDESSIAAAELAAWDLISV